MKQDEEAMVTAQLRVINAHYQSQCNRHINLQHLSDVVGASGTLHRGRPTMLTCRMMTKRVQFFPSGTVQILGGGVTPSLLNHLSAQISHLLSQCDSNLLMGTWKVNNIVFHFDLMKRIKLNNSVSTKNFSFEPELFPAALISKWHPAHVTLFSNGKGMITGVKSHDTAQCILDELPSYITQVI